MGSYFAVCRYPVQSCTLAYHRIGQTLIDSGGSRIWEKGGGGGVINIFTTGRGYERGRSPSCDSKGVWGALLAPVVGSGASAFLLLCLFSMKFTVISDTKDSNENLENSSFFTMLCMHGSYCSAIKFMMQSFCEFVTKACAWPCFYYTCTISSSISIFSLFSSIATWCVPVF